MHQPRDGRVLAATLTNRTLDARHHLARTTPPDTEEGTANFEINARHIQWAIMGIACEHS